MGLLLDLFKTTLGGGSGNDGAFNAHLAELAIKNLGIDEKQTLATEVINMGVEASGGRVNADQFCDTFNRHNRLCQLNLIALALAKLNVCILPNVKWMPIRNPFALEITQEEILANAIYFRKYHNLHVKIEEGKIDLRDWLVSIEEMRQKFVKSSIEGVLGFLKFIESETITTKERFMFVLGMYCMAYITYLVSTAKSKDEAQLLFPIILIEFNKLFPNEEVVIGDFIYDETEKLLCCEVFGVANFDILKEDVMLSISTLVKFIYDSREKIFFSGFQDIISETGPAISYKLVSSLSRQYSGNEEDCFLLFSTIHIPMISIINQAYNLYKW